MRLEWELIHQLRVHGRRKNDAPNYLVIQNIAMRVQPKMKRRKIR